MENRKPRFIVAALFEQRLIDRDGSQKVYRQLPPRKLLIPPSNRSDMNGQLQKPAPKKPGRVISLPLVLGAG
jgi:hypothetical protein